ncbi:NUDIX hydrolase [Nocardioides coralli]|nr:NUDIX hydrolase [Nocardioides coralli]
MVFVDRDLLFDRDLLQAARLQLPDVVDSPTYLGRFGGRPSRRFAGVVLVDRSGALLLQERDEHPRIDPEKWGLVGGHLDDCEDFLTGAVRELEEETGVELTPDELTLHGEYRVDHRDAYGSVDRMRVFAAAADLTDADIDCREGRQIVFVDPAAVATLDLTAAGSVVLPAFLRSGLYAALRG